MSETELDALIEAAKPNLRKAIQAVLENKTLAMMLPLGLISFPNKQTWGVQCFVMIEPMAELVAPLIMTGIPAMLTSQAKPHLKPADVVAPNSPAPKQGGIPVPGL